MSDDDLIRRGDARDILSEEGWLGRSFERLAALPAVTQPAPDAAAIREAVAKVRTKLADQDNATLLLGAEWALTMIEALTEKPHDRAALTQKDQANG